MWQKLYFSIVVFTSSAKLHQALKQCSEPTKSTHDYYLAGHVISTRIVRSLSECLMLCSHDFVCKSMNFRLADKSCELNNADRFTHPEDFGTKEGYVYMATTEKHRKVWP